jgi:hypothetical protein
VTREHDLAGVEFVNGAAGAPQVDGEVVLQTKDDFWRAIKSEKSKKWVKIMTRKKLNLEFPNVFALKYPGWYSINKNLGSSFQFVSIKICIKY